MEDSGIRRCYGEERKCLKTETDLTEQKLAQLEEKRLAIASRWRGYYCL